MSGDYISRKAAMSLPFVNDQYDHVHADPHFIAGCETYKEWLETIPAADVVEVIRCKDCKHAHMTDDGLCKYCDQLIENGVDEAIYFPGDYFCADGERKKANNA